MKQEFQMTEEEVQAIYDISRRKVPVILVGGVSFGQDAQKNANALWKSMADKYGFIWDSVEPSSRGDKFFLATPTDSKEVRIAKQLQAFKDRVVETKNNYEKAKKELREFEDTIK